MLKTCRLCLFELEIHNFVVRSRSNSGHTTECKNCIKLQKKNYPSSTQKYKQQYLLKNKEHINSLRRESYNIENSKISNRKNYLKHKEKRLAHNIIYYL